MHDFSDFRQPNFMKFEHNTSIGCRNKFFRNTFENSPVRVVFPKKTQFFQRLATSSRHNSAVIIDRRKFITNGLSARCLVSIFTVGINSKSFPWPVHSVLSQIFLRRWTPVDGISDCLSGRGLMTSSVSRRQPVTIDC